MGSWNSVASIMSVADMGLVPPVMLQRIFSGVFGNSVRASMARRKD